MSESTRISRPQFPKRAVITGGMPYGNKDLHFGHIGGMFVHADIFSRFLKDRLGKDNVIFVSGTDCYGSPIVEYHRIMVEKGEFSGSLRDFVLFNHKRQKEVLDAYEIGLDLFATSSFDRSGEIHQETCAWVIKTLFDNGHLIRLEQPQFYDPKHKIFLNGRQVVGQCPVIGCSSEQAYADECSLGHQIAPQDLINPKSTLSGEKPEMRMIANWYLDLEKFRPHLEEWVKWFEALPGSRISAVTSLREFLEAPALFVKNELMDQVNLLQNKLPSFVEEDSKSASRKLVFKCLADREKTCLILNENGIRFRAGKTIVPFRLTGNLDWGLKAPDLADLINLTWWVWPESLVAPISFVKTFLESKNAPADEWKKWWSSPETSVYQFIGEDNLFFYGLAEIAMFLGTQRGYPSAQPKDGDIGLPHLIVNRHILFLDTKASSSGKVKPPMARDLLSHYTAEQLRAHFFSLGLGLRSTGFKPKYLNTAATERDGDPVMKEGNLLSNVLNKAIRSCFYSLQQDFGGKLPTGKISDSIRADSEKLILDYENLMSRHEFHTIMAALDNYIRSVNKIWSAGMNEAKNGNETAKAQTLVDCFYMIRVCTALMHPIAPKGCEMAAQYLGLTEKIWDWSKIFLTLEELIAQTPSHQFMILEPREDFFEKHESQFI